MKTEPVIKMYTNLFDDKHNVKINKLIKAVIINLDGKDYTVTNDNFNTRRKYPDFTEGKKAAGLHKHQIVFLGIELARVTNDRFIDNNDQLHHFKDYFEAQH